MRPDLPTGTVTFLFTDIEGSTRLLHELGPERYGEALLEHRRIVRAAFEAHGGVEVDTQGDAFFVAFPSAPGAIDAARRVQDELATGPIRVRLGIHSGTPHVTEQGYVGEEVHKGARIAAAGHGGQVLLSKETRDLVDVEVTDLGEHRLKDFDQAVPIFQLGNERFPPLKTISNTNLPRPASSFVGREREVGELTTRVREARIVTATGPGGTGKTRLAIEAATELVPSFKAGVFWVGLAPVRDPALVVAEISRTLGAKDGPAEHIADRELLLVLDNFEQVVDAAADIASLVEACPNLKVLVTSRELLRIRGEAEYAVLPLADPDAVELFCMRANVEADDAVADLCRALDNLPLALELAAARASILSPKQILERLSGRLDTLEGGRDVDPRQRTLRATIEWSHDLLTPEEQELFARLAVFRGGCTLETAEDVAQAALDVLQSLVGKSLVRRTDDRFWMLETMREYALERLEASGEAEELRGRHAEHFLALAEEAEPHLMGRDTEPWHDRLEREHDNFRAALDHLESVGDTARALRLANGIEEFWDQRAHHLEGLRRLRSLLEADPRPTDARGTALVGASILASKVGDMDAGARWAQEALELYGRLENPRGTALAKWSLGYLALEAGDLERARELVSESVRLLREIGDDVSLLWASRTLAFTYLELGDLERARQLYEENMERARAAGDQALQAVLLSALATIALDQGRPEDALTLRAESLRLLRDVRDPMLVRSGICSAARILASLGEVAVATRLLGYSEAQVEELGASEPWVDRMNEATLTTIREQLDEQAFADAWEQGRKLTPDEALDLALAFVEKRSNA